ncbi:MAG: hypothetical protein ACPGWR_20260 [Ardenticatenaceae bacterium]
MIKTTISWPEPMLEEAREAATIAGQSLEIFVLQAALERMQRLNSKPGFNLEDWTSEQMQKDRAWIRENSNDLAQNHAHQWVFVHSQKVVGAHSDMGKAQKQAEQVLGNINQAGALAFFVGGSRYVL